MDFNKKLQSLRKQHGMTQEQLSIKLNISRTAVSKWESGRGFPNINALKDISKIFNTPIDNLLSGDKIIDIANEDKKRGLNKLTSLVFGLMDSSLFLFIFLPLYGMDINGYIKSVNLLELGDSFIKTVYQFSLILITIFGILQLLIYSKSNLKTMRLLRVLSFIFNSIIIVIFIISRSPYVAFFLFIFFIIKTVISLRK